MWSFSFNGDVPASNQSDQLRTGSIRQTASALMVQKQAQAEAAALEMEAVYARMSDAERMRGVVYE